MLVLSGVNNNNRHAGKATARDHNFDLYGLRNNQRGARMGVFKVAKEAPVQTSKSVSVTMEGHAIQSLHDPRPESFSD